MATFNIKVEVGGFQGHKRAKLDLVVDTGAHLSIVPKRVLQSLGLRPRWRRQSRQSRDGERIERKVGVAIFKCNGVEGASEVIFGEKTDKALLGALTLESLGLKVNPKKRTVEREDLLLLVHLPIHFQP
mgnify:CR=1 FL=1